MTSSPRETEAPVTDLPPIPEQARDDAETAVRTALWAVDGWEADHVDRIITGVWPHLYAAALHHAADSDRLLNSTVDLACAHQAITELGRMADEALTGH